MGYRSVLSVTTPATTFDLTTLLRVKAALDINDATMQQDQWLRTAITSCSLAVARECNRVLVRQSYSETFYPVGCGWSDTLQLSRWPVIEITAITNGSALVDGTDYFVSMETGQLTRLSGGTQIAWSTPSPPMVVEYDAGYDPIPADLQDIVHSLIQPQWLASSGERDPFLRGEDIPGVASYQYATLASAAGGNFSALAKDALNGYKMPAFC